MRAQTLIDQGRAEAAAQNADDRAFVARTLRSTAVVAGLVGFVLASYGQTWAIVPMLCGTALGVALLAGMNWWVRRVFTPENAHGEKNVRERRGKAALLGFALIKYPLVGVLLFIVTRAWDNRAVAAFAGGFVLLHFVIGLRAIGRLLFVGSAPALSMNLSSSEER